MQVMLLVTVLFAAVWFVALRPKDSAGDTSSASVTATPSGSSPKVPSGPTAPGVRGLTSAIDKAHGAVATSQANGNRLGAASRSASGDPAGAPAATAPSSSAPPVSAPGSASSAPPTHRRTVGHLHGRHHARAGTHRPLHVGRGPARAAHALAAHRVLAILFYNRRAADDRAVLAAFRTLRHRRGVVFVSAPLNLLAAYSAITAQVAVTSSPTFLVFDRTGQYSELIGFTDPTTMTQRIDDALAVRAAPHS